MRRLKRCMALLMTATIMLSLMACGGSGNTDVTEVTSEVSETEEVTEKQEAADVAEEETAEEAGGNMIKGGDFTDGVGSFTTYTTNGGSVNIDANSDGELQIDIANIGSVEHGVQVYYDGFAMQEGGVYQLDFDVHSTIERDIVWRIQLNGGDYHAYATDTVSVTGDVQHYSTEFTMEETSDPAPRFCFNLGYVQSMQDAGVDAASVEAHSIMIDNISLVLNDGSNMQEVEALAEAPKIKVNQVGYRLNDSKVAVFSDLAEDDKTFKVLDVASGEAAFEGTMTASVEYKAGEEMDSQGDFSALNKEGTYKIVTGKGEESGEFKIADNVYDDTYASVVKMMYLQRCGEELSADIAGDYAHPACHTGEATIYGTDKKIDVSGGWHDAGDYGRYVVAGAKAVADMLLAYENAESAKLTTDNFGTPDSGDGISDFLQEAKYELDWMLKMQDASSGGVYHKVTCAAFPGEVMPQDETEELIVAPISNAATGDFAAVMAMAGRIFAKAGEGTFNEAGAQYTEAAKKAWDYLLQHKAERGFTNPEDISTGEYPDKYDRDEYFWAAAELYKTTEDAAYKDAMAEYIGDERNITGMGWQSVGLYGAYAALTTPALATDSSNMLKTIQDTFDAQVAQTLEYSGKNPYMADTTSTFTWGSNMNIANSGMVLMMANSLSPDEKYVKCAKGQLDYLLGVNATGYCFVTGQGYLSPTHPHHRPSQATGKCMTGMLIGGPDSNLEDPYAKGVLADVAPAKCYVDNVQSFSCNEITIYWNSPLIYLMTALQDK
ncbi:MAG: glycoside hydrolase family 9 protein [Lachnospiraceae bacterium]|nr:glycoside hydrolase family 9 protein [Lachnospiraceae bacterium]